MEYPGSLLTKNIRHGILILFVAAFFILAPLIVLYTVGYRYDWRNGLLKETGAISIDVEPSNTVIFLNEQKLKEQSPVRLSTVIPNRYGVRFALPGYYDWSKEIVVQKKQTVYLKDILLLKKRDPEFMVSGTIKTMGLSSDGRYLLYNLATPTKQEVRIVTLSSATDRLVSTFGVTSTVAVEWAKKSNYFALITGEATRLSVRLAEATQPRELWNIAADSAPITQWQWRDSQNPEFYYSTSSSLFSALPTTRVIRPLTTSRLERWYFKGTELWTMRFATTTGQWLITKDALGFNTLFAVIDEKLFEPTPANDTTGRTMLVYDNTVVVATSPHSYLIVTPDKKFAITADSVYLSPHANLLLLWSAGEVWAYTNGQDPYVLSRSGDRLETMVAMDKFNTLALAGSNGTTALLPYYFVSTKLLPEQTNYLAVDEKKRMLYGAGLLHGEAGLWRLSY